MLNFKNKSVLVVGGAGFIGSHLIDELIEEEPEKIIVVDNLFLGDLKNLENSKHKFKNLLFEDTDATDYALMDDIFKKNNIDIVFNLAMIPLPTSLVKPSWTFENNIKITEVLCEFLRKDMFKTLGQFSSSEVYGSLLKEKIDEAHPLLPKTPYAASKAACDHLVYSYYETFGIDMFIIRPFNNYGPRQNDKSYAGVIPLTIKRIINKKQPVIYGDGNQTRDFIFVGDTAKATVKSYKSKNTRGKIFNVGSGKEISINTIINMISNLLGWKGGTLFESRRPGDVDRHLADVSLAKKLIDFKPSVDLEKGMRITVDWYKNKYR